MAQGITPRTRLSMRDYERDPQGALRDLQRWANYLPFAAAGFHAIRTTNATPISAGTTVAVTWDKVIDNREGWFATGAPVVPVGLSGLYMMSTCLYIAGAPSVGYVGVRSIAVDGTYTAHVNLKYVSTDDRPQITCVGFLNEGDKLQVLLNPSATTTVTAYAGDNNTPKMPYLRVYRIALI